MIRKTGKQGTGMMRRCGQVHLERECYGLLFKQWTICIGWIYTYHFIRRLNNSVSTGFLPLTFFTRAAVLYFLSLPNSSKRRSQRASTLLSAMQLMVTTLVEDGSTSRLRRTEFTRAVFPVPGGPEMYKLVGVPPSTSADSKKDVTNFRITPRSWARPAICPVLLQVARRHARARA